MIQTKDLSYSYNSKSKIDFPDFHFQEKSHWLILGQSGCGKTTLLHLLGGLLTPKNGKVEVEGTDLGQLPKSKLDRFRGQNIGIVFQRSHFVRSVNVEENLALAQSLAGRPVDKPFIQDLMNRLNVGHKANAKPRDLSQGEQQRVAIARALVNRPKLILADEPTSALDDVNTEEVIHLLEEQATAVGATLVIVTHDKRLKDQFKNRIELKPIGGRATSGAV
jgi:ABC-type lipoprotein export system ATPase subunit